MDEIKEKLKELRLEKNLKIEDLAKEIGYSRTIVYYWENGQRKPNATALKALSDYFDVSIDYILGIEENESLTKANRFNNGSLTEEEKELLEQFRCLGKAEKHAVALSCETFYKNSVKNGTTKNYKENNL